MVRPQQVDAEHILANANQAAGIRRYQLDPRDTLAHGSAAGWGAVAFHGEFRRSLFAWRTRILVGHLRVEFARYGEIPVAAGAEAELANRFLDRRIPVTATGAGGR